MQYKKPSKLQPGDTVAIVSPSWGGPSAFPQVYEKGLQALRDWGLIIKEFPTARMDADLLRANPLTRAQDINNAFSDPEVKGIFASIGGNDSVRILPFLNRDVISQNPKILMGYSDTTTLHVFMNQLGLVTFYGPSIMAGFSQMDNLPEDFRLHVRKMLFDPQPSHEYRAYGKYCNGYPNWSGEGNVGKINPLAQDDGWHWLQGKSSAQGELFGGCLEVLEMMKATAFWPRQEFWKEKILFLETSEEKPSLHYIDHVLRNYGMLGIYDQIGGLIFARARDFSAAEKLALEEKIVSIIAGEFGRRDLPVIANFDVGHTDPQLVLPLGVRAEINCPDQRIALLENWTAST